MADEKFVFEKLQTLLILQKEKKIQRNKRGENFNIFSVLNLSTRETRLHSALVAELLNPNGSHGLGFKPLKSLLSVIGADAFSDEELILAKTYTEYNIGTLAEDYSFGGKIDILIEINGKYIVIENKIYAGDQPKQMFRYCNFCKPHLHRLLYLTLDHHVPDEGSLNGLQEGTDFQCISYGVEITKWLRECICYASVFPLVRETLQQYLQTVLNLTYQEMDKEEDKRFFELMADYPEVITKIMNNSWNFRQFLVTEYFVKPFKQWCITNGYFWYEDPDFTCWLN